MTDRLDKINIKKEVYISYDTDKKRYELRGAAFANETNFSEIVDFLLHLVIESKDTYNLIINKSSQVMTQTEGSILEKIVRVNEKINLIKN